MRGPRCVGAAARMKKLVLAGVAIGLALVVALVLPAIEEKKPNAKRRD